MNGDPMAKRVKRVRKVGRKSRAARTYPSLSDVEKGMKVRIVALVMLILASSLGLWFAEFQWGALLLWLLIVFAGAYAVFEFGLFVSKVLIIVSAIIMELLVLEGVPNLLVFGTPGNLMLLTFGFLDAVLIYALSKL